MLEQYLGEIIFAIVSSIALYLGKQTKDRLEKRDIRRIIEDVVIFVEEEARKDTTLRGAVKMALATEKAMEWIVIEGYSISPVELEILIKANVNRLRHQEESK